MAVIQRKIVSWVGLVLLAFNLAAGVALPIQSAQSHTINDDLSICTQSGMVSVGTFGQSQKNSDHHTPHGLCAFCLPLLHGGVDSVSDIPPLTAPTILVGAADLSGFDHNLAPVHQIDVHHNPRAPPSPAI